MTSSSAETFVAAFTEGWRAPADADAFADAFEPWLAEDVRLVQPAFPDFIGHEGLREQFARPLFTLMPDAHGTVLSWAAAGDVVFIEIRVEGTVAGEPSGWTSVDKITLRDGRAVERVANFDPAPLLEAAARYAAAAS
jgi:SnoaL-like domain